MFKVGRHEIRFVSAFLLILANVVIVGILEMLSREAIAAGLTPIVPLRILETWQGIALLASPFILVAGIFPAGKGDILKWN